MILTMPEVKEIEAKDNRTAKFDSFIIHAAELDNERLTKLLGYKLWNASDLLENHRNPMTITVSPLGEVKGKDTSQEAIFRNQGYRLLVTQEEILINCDTEEGFLNGIATLKQIIEKEGDYYTCQEMSITDWPSIWHRSISTTFAWYAGYGRLGFDMQLWGLEEWTEFLNICSDYKINQLNMVLYGYWPFELEEYPESVLRNISMKVWNPESNNWVAVQYMHPNIAKEFLPQLIEYGHELGIQFFAYIGLNSYSGGYANAHKNKRMQMPPNSNFINDFDSLCLSNEDTIEYLKSSIRKILKLGFDGIDFEESEEAYWYCNCERCKATFWKDAKTPEETLHAANTMLLDILYREIRKVSPSCIIGIRAWRQPPLVRSDELIQEMVESIPKDVVLFWSPGQYVEDSEFEKWVNAFGKERIWARDTEAIGFAAGFGRLVRPFKYNGLRCEEESITQYVEEDIRQHKGSVKMGVAGINGYLFEWYGFFMPLFAHSYYGWGGEKDVETFCEYSLKVTFKELAADILDVSRNMLTIHESQLKIFELEFPFAKNKVEKRDIPRIQKAIEDYPRLSQKLEAIMAVVEKEEKIKAFLLHFKKWKVSLDRSRIIYDLALTCLQYESAQTEEDRRKYLLEMYWLNEKEFDIVKANYFDVNPVVETGIASCMIPYHELKRVISNQLNPHRKEENPIYLGVEALGWLWC